MCLFLVAIYIPFTICPIQDSVGEEKTRPEFRASHPALDRPLLTEGDGGGVPVASLVTEVLAPGEEEELRSDGLQTEASSESTAERRNREQKLIHTMKSLHL